MSTHYHMQDAPVSITCFRFLSGGGDGTIPPVFNGWDYVCRDGIATYRDGRRFRVSNLGELYRMRCDYLMAEDISLWSDEKCAATLKRTEEAAVAAKREREERCREIDRLVKSAEAKLTPEEIGALQAEYRDW